MTQPSQPPESREGAPLPDTSLLSAVQHAQARGVSRLEAQMLMLHVMGRSLHDRTWLIQHHTEQVDLPLLARYASLVQRRLSDEPLAYITGEKEFFGLTLQVDARVLDPRPDTETLVEWALDLIPTQAPRQVADLGTGSGAIALALKKERPAIDMTAFDISPEALDVARANAQRLALDVHCRQGAWLSGVQERFDVIVSNPPYIAAHDPHLQRLMHEPLGALASGSDGLHDLRLIVPQAIARLHEGGWLLLEHGHDQAPAVCALLADAGFVHVQSRPDLAGIARCSGGQRPKSP